MSSSKARPWLSFRVEQPYPAQRMPNKTRFTSEKAAKALAFQAAVGLRAKETMHVLGVPIVTREDNLYVVVDVRLYHAAPLTSSRRRYDVDNVLKAILDGANGVVWTDDWLVVAASVELIWSPNDDAAVVRVSVLHGTAVDPTYYTRSGERSPHAEGVTSDATPRPL